MWNLVSVRLETVLLSVQDRSTVCAKRTIGSGTFCTHPMVLLGDKAEVEAHFDPFGDSAKLDADCCTVYAERTLGSEIVLDAPNGILGYVGHVESCFGPFRDGVSVGAR